ncbi:MAG: DUF433 domain-containing protein [Candidatus Rokubacteria bacterium]|nr:DUF433 domain-containing protein [Candidatus Rokubacteria bacterium]
MKSRRDVKGARSSKSGKLIASKAPARESRVIVDPGTMLGKPVIRGTRITVELILRRLAEGATDRELLAAYPHLTREDLHAALAYAADVVAHEETIATAANAPARR